MCVQFRKRHFRNFTPTLSRKLKGTEYSIIFYTEYEFKNWDLRRSIPIYILTSNNSN